MTLMKTLLYLASGPFKEEYTKLPFDSMYFIDSNRALKQTFPVYPARIKFIGRDALMAIDLLKRDHIKIDCLVIINEGLFGGGGSYPIFSDFLMGYLSPFLKDEFMLITDLNPYQTTNFKALAKLDWAVEKVTEVFPGDKNYINPRIFTTYATADETFGQVFKMRKIKDETVFYTKYSQLKIRLIHGSIWNDAHDLDFIGLYLSNEGMRLTDRSIRNIKTSSDFFRSKPNVYNLTETTIEDVLIDAETKKAEVIDLVPWGASNYDHVFSFLEQHNTNSIKEVRFYHLNRNDFEGLYKSYANQIIEAYPNFFSDIIQSNAYYNQYLSVIKRSYGALMLKLCVEINQALSAEEDFRFSIIKLDSDELCVQSSTKSQFIQGLLQMANNTFNV